MRHLPNMFRSKRGSKFSWRVLFVLLSLLVSVHRADSADEEMTPSPTEAQLEQEGGNSWGLSAGGWFSIGGWSSSWRSIVSTSQSMFRWRFGNVPPETDEAEAETEVTGVAPSTGSVGRRCERLTLEMCQSLGYEETSMPNLLNHESQDIARLELEQYSALVRVNCSSGDMPFFLCALHAPKCHEEGGEGERLPPCRAMCQRIKSRCEVVMERFEYAWPSIFECEKYPDPLQAPCTGQ